MILCDQTGDLMGSPHNQFKSWLNIDSRIYYEWIFNQKEDYFILAHQDRS